MTSLVFIPPDLLPPALGSVQTVAFSICRASRVVHLVVMVSADCALHYSLVTGSHSDPVCLSLLHQRNAARCRVVAEKNGGLYIKTGQGVATMNNVLPPEYCVELSSLHDDVPKRTMEEILPELWRWLAADPKEFFSYISDEPVAAASIAQVHSGVTRQEGRKVAIKIQYREVKANFYGDMKAISAVFRGLRYFFPKYDFVSMMEAIEEFYALELNFEVEGRNAEEYHKYLSRRYPDHSVVAPRVLERFTREGLLVTDFFDSACRVTDIEGLRCRGLRAADVASLTIDAFSHMLFHCGLVHADPHPGNVLVRQHPDKTGNCPQIAILDFGLMARMNPEQRVEFCNIFNAAVMHNDEFLFHTARRMGMLPPGVMTDTDSKQAASVLGTLFIQEPYDLFEITRSVGILSGDVSHMQKFWDEQAESISRVAVMLPKEYIMALTNMDIVRSLHRDLGSPFNRLMAMAHVSNKVVAATHSTRKGWYRIQLWFWLHWRYFMMTVAELLFSFSSQKAAR